MNETEFRERLQRAWREPMTPAQEAECQVFLASHPELQALWDQEVGLNQVLERLPDVPVPTNFTARVMALTLAEHGRSAEISSESSGGRAWWLRWWPRLGLASALVVAAGIGVNRMRVENQKSLAAGMPMAEVLASLPQFEVLRDFEPIEQLANSPPATLVDMELLAALE